MVHVAKILDETFPREKGYRVNVGNYGHRLQVAVFRGDVLLEAAETKAMMTVKQLAQFITAVRDREDQVALKPTQR